MQSAVRLPGFFANVERLAVSREHRWISQSLEEIMDRSFLLLFVTPKAPLPAA
jgi:hypothetical protein